MRGSGELQGCGESPKALLNLHEPTGSSLCLFTHTLGGSPSPGYIVPQPCECSWPVLAAFPEQGVGFSKKTRDRLFRIAGETKSLQHPCAGQGRWLQAACSQTEKSIPTRAPTPLE